MPIVEPIRPDEIGNAKAQQYPAFVLRAFNQEIAANYTAGRAVVYQNKVIQTIIECALQEGAVIDRGDVFDKKYLNVEEIYEDAGWKVSYDKPGYNESYEANFTFKKR